MKGDGASIPTVVMRGIRRRCPACGKGRLFDGFFTARDRCDACGLDLVDRRGDTWAILYLATGGITGVSIILLLLITPRDLQLGRLALIPIVAAIFGLTIPVRRGFALAVGYAISRVWGDSD